MLKKDWHQKKFWVKKIWVKKILSKKSGRVKQGVGCMIPPPKKIVGLKFCWVVLTCPKRFFVKQKFICRVNPGKGGVEYPPPENSRVKIVLGCC